MQKIIKKFKRDDKVKEIKKDLEKDYDESWMHDSFEEGQLSLDVYETDKNLIIKSTIAGVKPEDIDISINNDMLTIKGKREIEENIKEESYLYRECYWGSFSRSIILPVEVDKDDVEAVLENGVLTVKLKKIKKQNKISVQLKE